ncbi:hypothetical protein ABIA06_003281 [Bradyrhizobium yuanmingense]|uniref:hypothetical protein n=1 Tax=Bradyrhizobium yuanmingense TaxID=108015 RepID=UPI003517D01E
MWRLFYPLRYFSLVNDEKRHIDLWPTIVLAAIIAAPFIFLDGLPFFHKDGFLDKILTLTSALTGFYVAALVAAATFTHPDLDKVFKAGPVALISRDADGTKIAEHLTRREFVCIIFGYLAFSSFILSVFAAFIIAVSNYDHAAVARWHIVGPLLGGDYLYVTRSLFISAFTLAIAHLIIVTSLGLYYLMDRLYRRDREIVTPKTNVPPPHSDSSAA